MADQPPAPLTVGELKKRLEGVPDDTLVVLLQEDMEDVYTSDVIIQRGMYGPTRDTTGQFFEDIRDDDDDEARQFYNELASRHNASVAIGLTPAALC